MTTQFKHLVLRLSVLSAASVFAVGCSKPVDSPPPASQTPPANSVSPPSATVTLPASGSVGTAIDDTVVTTSVKSALLADADTKSFDVKVETRKGVVMLSGFVDNQMQVDRANTVAKGVAGVAGVENSMTVKGGTTTVGTKVDDSIVTGKVKAALIGDEAIKSMDIAVVTKSGEVQLSGFVNSQTQIDRAMLLAKAVEGVTAVNNEMKIKK